MIIFFKFKSHCIYSMMSNLDFNFVVWFARPNPFNLYRCGKSEWFGIEKNHVQLKAFILIHTNNLLHNVFNCFFSKQGLFLYNVQTEKVISRMFTLTALEMQTLLEFSPSTSSRTTNLGLASSSLFWFNGYKNSRWHFCLVLDIWTSNANE